MKQEEIEILFWKYIDRQCTSEEHIYVQKMLAENADWQQLLASLQVADALITDNLVLEEPSPQFTQQVMAQIQINVVKKAFISKWLVKGVAAFFIVAIIALSVYTLTHSSTATNNYLYSFDMSKYNSALVRLFLFANIIAALVFVDTLLRRRLKTH